MTSIQQQIWDCRIRALNQIGVDMPERAEIGHLALDVDAIRRIGREAVRQGVGQIKLIERLRAAVPRSPDHDRPEAMVTTNPDPVATVPPDAAASGAATGEVKGSNPGRVEAKPERRANKTRTVRKDAESMTAAKRKAEQPRFKIAEAEELSPDAEPNGQDREQPVIAPVMVDADDAAAMFSVSVRTWRRRDRDGSVPRGAMLKGRKLWRIRDLELWSEWGLPNRSAFDRRLRDQRNAARH